MKYYIKLIIAVLMYIVILPKCLSSNQTHVNDDVSQQDIQNQNLTVQDIIHVISKKILEMGIPRKEFDDVMFWDKIRDNIIISAKAMDTHLGDRYGTVIVDGVIKETKYGKIYKHPTYGKYQKIHRKAFSKKQKNNTRGIPKTMLEYFNAVDRKSNRIINTLNKKEILIRNITEGLLNTLDKTIELGLKSQDRDKYESSLMKTVDIINNQLLQTAIEEQQLKSKTSKTVSRRSFHNASTECGCDCISNYFCSAVKILDLTKCVTDKTIINVDKICDAHLDCADWSDELLCGNIILEKIHLANAYVEDLAFMKEFCPISKQSENILIESLEEILKIQYQYLNKYQHSRWIKEGVNKTQGLNQAARLIKKLSHIIDETFCVNILHLNATSIDPTIIDDYRYKDDNTKDTGNFDDNEMTISRRFMSIAASASGPEIEKHRNVSKLRLPRDCQCSQGICKMECDKRCKTYCERKFSLGKVPCNANDRVINAHQMCNGIIDCIDASDEACERNAIKEGYIEPTHFEIIDMLENLLIRNVSYDRKLRDLYDHLKLLLKLINDGIKDKQFTQLRDNVFAEMPGVYEEIIRRIPNFKAQEEVYSNLNFIHEKLVTALKNYQNGYNFIVDYTRKCDCAYDRCANLSNCDPICSRTCLAGSMFMRFSCKVGDQFVSIKSICNGKPECVNGFDEEGCIKGRCKKNDLLEIQNEITNVVVSDKKETMMMMKEMFSGWIFKNIKIIDNMISHMKISFDVLRDVIKNSILGLASTYAVLNETQRDNKTTMKFIKTSQELVSYLKRCNF